MSRHPNGVRSIDGQWVKVEREMKIRWQSGKEKVRIRVELCVRFTFAFNSNSNIEFTRVGRWILQMQLEIVESWRQTNDHRLWITSK